MEILRWTLKLQDGVSQCGGVGQGLRKRKAETPEGLILHLNTLELTPGGLGIVSSVRRAQQGGEAVVS